MRTDIGLLTGFCQVEILLKKNITISIITISENNGLFVQYQ